MWLKAEIIFQSSSMANKKRGARNWIIVLYNASGVWVDADADVEEVAVSYFWDIFSTTSPSEIEEVLREVPSMVSDQTNRVLTALATEKEVRRALFIMHPEKVPRPDGTTVLVSSELGTLLKRSFRAYQWVIAVSIF